jgi:hypothetical protein
LGLGLFGLEFTKHLFISTKQKSRQRHFAQPGWQMLRFSPPQGRECRFDSKVIMLRWLLFYHLVLMERTAGFRSFQPDVLFPLTTGIKFCLFGFTQTFAARSHYTGRQTIHASKCPTVSDKRLRAVYTRFLPSL